MNKKKIVFIGAGIVIILAVLVLCIPKWTLPYKTYGFDREVGTSERELRLEFVSAAEKWLGTQEGSEDHLQILSIYNCFEPLAQGYLVTEEDNWCATFVSTVAIQTQLTEIIPTECGCQRQIALFEDLGRWEEKDDYIPLPGDIIYYCSSDKDPFSDCTGWSDHVGIVVGTCDGYIKVIEGNSRDSVRYRYLKVNAVGIRGFALPDYGQALKNPDYA